MENQESLNVQPAQVTEAYDAEQIQVLEGLEAVRKRPGMYIGSTGERGLHHLVYEIVDNAIDETLAGYCDHIEVDILPGNIIRVADNGRGIPVGIQPKLGIPAVSVVFTVLHAGGKFGGSGYKVSGGLHGVGASVVNAISEWLEVEVRDGEHRHFQRFERGVPACDLKVIGDTDETGTTVTFKPDALIFTDTTEYDYNTLLTRLREQAFLNAGVRITLTDQRPVEESGEAEQRQDKLYFEGGIRSYVEFLMEKRGRTPLFDTVVYLNQQEEDSAAEIALQYNDGFDTNVISFANNMHTIDGGTHESAFKTSLTRVINAYARKFKYLKDNDNNLKGDDVQEGLVAVVSVKLTDAQFEGQTKAKLGQHRHGLAGQPAMVGDKLADLSRGKSIGPAKVIVDKALAASAAREAAQKARDLTRAIVRRIIQGSACRKSWPTASPRDPD